MHMKFFALKQEKGIKSLKSVFDFQDIYLHHKLDEGLNQNQLYVFEILILDFGETFKMNSKDAKIRKLLEMPLNYGF
jgi:hypothetical protein